MEPVSYSYLVSKLLTIAAAIILIESHCIGLLQVVWENRFLGLRVRSLHHGIRELPLTFYSVKLCLLCVDYVSENTTKIFI